MSNVPRRAVPRPAHGRRPAAVLLIAFLALLLPAQSQAKNEITKFAVGPIPAKTHCNPNLEPKDFASQAATRQDMCIAFYLGSGDPVRGDDVKDTIADTPQGFLATADSSPQCTFAQLALERGDAARCPANAQVGEIEAIVRVDFMGVTIPQTIHGKVWNMEHSPDEVARLGIELAPELGGIALPHIKLTGRTSLRPNPDVGLRTRIENQPRTAKLGALGEHPIAMDGLFMRLWGSKADHPTLTEDFGLLGSDCSTDQVSRLTAVSYSGDTTGATDTYRLTDCDKVPFGVQAKVETAERRPDVTSQTTITVTIDDNKSPRVTGNMKRTVLTLPAGLELGAQIASGEGGLPVCTEEQFGWDQTERTSCPAGSKVADVAIISPLQANTFAGAAYIGVQKAEGELPQLFLEGGFGSLPDSPRVKLRGSMRIDEQGRIESTLDNLPQVLFREFKLTFRGGPHAPMITPRQCGTTQGYIEATPASTGQPVRHDLPLTIDEDCQDPANFAPSMELTTSNPQAGGRTVLNVKTSRPDRSARLARVEANLPAGVISDLNQATECATDQAAALQCPESSRIGTVTAQSGVGPAPYTVKGNVYLRERQEGDVAGVVIATPVQFGGVNLGTLDVPARIKLRPDDLGLTFTADVPQRYKGLSLNLRSFDVALDRPDFAMNPTNCSQLSSTSTLFSDLGGQATVPTSLQVGGCAALGFDPSLGLTVSGTQGQGGKPSLQVRVALAKGGSNIRSTAVTLPAGLGADLDQVSRACAAEAWATDSCPDDAVVGTVKATVAITPEVITGRVYMVRVAGKSLPGIGMKLEGRFASRILGTITVVQPGALLRTEFPTLPDVPISQLDLNLEGGPRGALTSTKALCGSGGKITLRGSFTGQSGASADRQATANCSAQYISGTPLLRVTGSTRTSLKLRFDAATGTKLKTVRFALPGGITLAKAKVARNKTLRGTKTAKVRGAKTIDGRIPSTGRVTYTVTIPKGALVRSKAANRKKQFALSARVALTNGDRATLRATIKR